MTEQNELDAHKATKIVREYCEESYGSLPFLLFRIHSVKPNTAEGIWLISCSFKPTATEKSRVYYKFKVNIKTNKIEEVREIKEEETSLS